MKIRLEISCLATHSISGVGYYTKRLTEALDKNPDVSLSTHYFNFLNRQPVPDVTTTLPSAVNHAVPLRIYAKMDSFNFAPPFDLHLPKTDLTIFPNFATWPSVKSGLVATVIHDLTYLRFPEATEAKNLAHLHRVVPRSIAKADIIITVSESVKSELIKEFSLDPKRCVVTPVPPESAYYVTSKIDIPAKYNLPTKKYIFFIGNLEPRKDVPTLVAAYRMLPKDIKDEYSLVLAGGKGWKSEKSKQAIQEAIDAKEKVIHIGYADQADAPALFQQASLFVMPSLYEGFGMPILEAMAGKTPVVASDIPVFRELGDDALLFSKARDSADFSRQMLRALTDRRLVKSLLAKSQPQLKKTSWETNAKTIVNAASTD